MEYISAAQISEKWGVSVRQVQRLLADGRIPRSKKHGRIWMIPDDAEKPDNPRKENKEYPASPDMGYVFEVTSIPKPSDNPCLLLQIVTDGRAKLHYESEFAYIRGDFAKALRCFQQADTDDAFKVRLSVVAVGAAISLGDYQAYAMIEAYLKDCIIKWPNSVLSLTAEMALASAAMSVFAPNMVPDWLKEGDFSAFPVQASLPYLFALRARYFLCVGGYEAALAMAQTALAFGSRKQGFVFSDIYLRIVCAYACHRLEREDESKRWLLEAMDIALPHGFITPFADCVSDFGGMVEQCLLRAFPECFDAVVGQWKRTAKNWIAFHNQFTKDNITSILSLREYHIAQMVARRVPYAKIAEQYNISVGRLKNIMVEIYDKLFISGRDELAKYVLVIK